jgi:hypothetical protein
VSEDRLATLLRQSVPSPESSDFQPRTAREKKPVPAHHRKSEGWPDPCLVDQTSIADAIRAGQPAVVVFSTPVYCVSRFCGPVTEMIGSLERKYRGDAAFIHVEIWKDFQANETSETANEWLLRDGTVNEPWLFMIDRDGTISARWDNLFTQPEAEDGLSQLLG